MKDFFKTTLAVILGIVITSAVSVFLCIGLLGTVSLVSNSVPAVPLEGVLKIDMSKIVVEEQTRDADPIQSFRKNQPMPLGIHDALNAIRAAANDSGIKYIYLKPDGGSTSLANLKELRDALVAFRENSSKAVVAYLENPTTGSYYLASVADKVYMTPYPGGTYALNGISMQTVYLGKLLNFLGINFQLTRHGKYKSAGEMFTREKPSDENVEQYDALVKSLWHNISSEICRSRDIEAWQLNSAINDLKLVRPVDFVHNKLVDELLTRNELENKLAALSLTESFENVSFINFRDYALTRPQNAKSGKTIAVIYADGEIIDGSDIDQMAGDRFASVIEEVRNRSDVQAVVLRVNSPGGSVVAAEKIKGEIDLIKGVKPLVASFGSYAASGGYWISAGCDHIYSNPLCLTGSIGVFGMVPEISKVSKFMHINFETFSSNEHSDMYTMTRPFDEDEQNYMERSIDQIYDRFITLVAEGRATTKAHVDAVGQGRVWTGSAAKSISLVDDMGGLEDAIAWAAEAAGDADLANWNIEGFPKPLSAMEQMLKSVTNPQESEDFSVLVRKFKDVSVPRMEARLPYEIVLQ